MILKLNEQELAELSRYDGGEFGQDDFDSFIAEMCVRVDDETGEVDMDRDDFEKIATFKEEGFDEPLKKIFDRPMNEAFAEFFGPAWNSDSPKPDKRV